MRGGWLRMNDGDLVGDEDENMKAYQIGMF